MALTIPSGPYFGFTQAELLAELARYKAARQQAHSRLAGSTINGQTFTFASGRSDGSLADWQESLQAALAYFDSANYAAPATSSTAIRFAPFGGTTP